MSSSSFPCIARIDRKNLSIIITSHSSSSSSAATISSKNACLVAHNIKISTVLLKVLLMNISLRSLPALLSKTCLYRLFTPFLFKYSFRSFACVVLPLPSIPSKTIHVGLFIGFSGSPQPSANLVEVGRGRVGQGRLLAIASVRNRSQHQPYSSHRAATRRSITGYREGT